MIGRHHLKESIDRPKLNDVNFSQSMSGAVPVNLQPWYGSDFDFLGSGIKYKTILFLELQVSPASSHLPYV